MRTDTATTGARQVAGGRKSREERWAELLQVATEVFYEKGYDGASLQNIADRLGILKGSLYYYIRSKEQLLLDVVRDVSRTCFENGLAHAEGEGDALDRLGAVIVGHVEFLCANLPQTAVFLQEVARMGEDRRAQILPPEYSVRDLLRRLIEEGQRDGLVRTDVDPALATLEILGSVNWVHRWYRAEGRATPDEIGRHLATTVIRGLAEPAALDGRGT